MSKHAWDHDHKIDFENGKVIDRGNYRTRKTLESWHTAVITNSDNNSKPLPNQYATLLRKITDYFLLDLAFQHISCGIYCFIPL